MTSYFAVNLPEPSNQDVGDVEITSVLFQNEIPTEPDFWKYLNQNLIEIDAADFSPANFYEFQYNRLTRIESEVFDLGDNFLDYEWYLDVCAYIRRSLITKQELVTEQLRLVDGLEAPLENPALTTGGFTLTRTNGVVTEELPPSAVTFINNRRIQIENRFFDVGFIYTFTYTSLVIERNPTVSLISEYRTSSGLFDIQDKDWVEFETNDIADTRFSLADNKSKRYIQFRVTANNIKRVEDLHIYSITARGILIPEEDRDVLNQGLEIIAIATASGFGQLSGTRAYGITDKASGSSQLTPNTPNPTITSVAGSNVDGAMELLGDSEALTKVFASASEDFSINGNCDGTVV